MKKLLAVALATGTALSIVGCSFQIGGGETSETVETTTTAAATTAATTVAATTAATTVAETTTAEETTAAAIVETPKSVEDKNVGDAVKIDIVKISVQYTIDKVQTGGALTIETVEMGEKDYSDYNLICKCYVDENNFYYMNISGADYCKHFSKTTNNVYDQTYPTKATIKTKVIYTKSIIDSSSDGSTISQTKILEFSKFVSVGKYDESSAVAYTENNVTNNIAAFLKKVYCIEVESYTYREKQGGSYAGYELSYLICKVSLEDQSSYYMAITADDYTKYFNSNADIKFNDSTFDLSGSRLSGNLEKIVLDNPITIYGFARTDIDEGNTVLLFDHKK